MERLGFPAHAIPLSGAIHIGFQDNRLFKHRIARFNYTTYDMRREEDVIHVETPQCNIMLLNSDYTEETRSTENPYLYAQVYAVYHANVLFVGLLPDGTRNLASHRYDFLWVHWYHWVPRASEHTLERISPVALSDPMALGFVDPADVLRAVHVIPRFTGSKETKPPPVSKFVPKRVLWKEYYINRFADRDLFMRYQLGMSVGHAYMRNRQFPSAVVPQIPQDFNYYLTPLTENSDLSLSHTRGTPDAPVPPGAILDPSTTSEVPDNDTAGRPEPEFEDSHADELPGDHWDDMEDRELVHYDDMYGGGGAGV